MLSVSLPLTGVLLADARPQGSAEGGAQASPRPGARARGHQGPQAQPQGDAKLPQGGLRGSQQARGAPQAEGENVLGQNYSGEGSLRQALAAQQEHQQQLHQGRGSEAEEDFPRQLQRYGN